MVSPLIAESAVSSEESQLSPMKNFIINPPVFYGAIVVIGLFLAVGVLVPGQAGALFGAIQTSILGAFGWFYLLSVGIFLLAVLVLCFGRFGQLKLGPDDSVPDFRFVSWIAMLFAGIAL